MKGKNSYWFTYKYPECCRFTQNFEILLGFFLPETSTCTLHNFLIGFSVYCLTVVIKFFLLSIDGTRLGIWSCTQSEQSGRKRSCGSTSCSIVPLAPTRALQLNINCRLAIWFDPLKPPLRRSTSGRSSNASATSLMAAFAMLYSVNQ